MVSNVEVICNENNLMFFSCKFWHYHIEDKVKLGIITIYTYNNNNFLQPIF